MLAMYDVSTTLLAVALAVKLNWHCSNIGLIGITPIYVTLTGIIALFASELCSRLGTKHGKISLVYELVSDRS